jgi:hypothetical protein
MSWTGRDALCIDAAAPIAAGSGSSANLDALNASGGDVPAPRDPRGDADTLLWRQASTPACAIPMPGDCTLP